MIPRRIALKGFLCYRDEQVIEFDGADLWVFSGRNGSGKSAVFDALTFALFGAHRGGRQSADRLINADSPGFEVVFDFDLGGDRYRIKRGLRRTDRNGSRLIYRHEAGEGGEVHWRPVPGTDSKVGFETWVREHLGLSYETFTSSVLLVQGQAEKLLGADHKERYNVLAGVEDLARFERLGKAAEARKGLAKARTETYRTQVLALPPVDEVAVEEAIRLAAEAEAAREAAAAELARLAEIRLQAHIWADVESQRVEQRREVDQAITLLADAEEIRQDRDRLRALNDMLPTLREALERRTRLSAAVGAIGRKEAEHEGLARALDLTDALAADMEAHRAAIAEEIDRDEARRREVVERLGALAVPLDRARRARGAREAVARIEDELAADPVDHGAEVARLEGEYRRRSDWRAAFSTLEGFARDRDGLASSRGRAQATRATLDELEAEAAGHSATCAAWHADVALARETASAARDRLTGANTVLGRVDASLKGFLDLDGAAACDRCGQPLTPSHFAAESARLRGEQAEAHRLAEEADRAYRIALAACHAAEAVGRDAGLRLQEAIAAVTEHRHRLDRAEGDASRHDVCCARAYDELPEPFRSRVAAAPPVDWAATTFPTAADLDDARRLVAGIGTVTEQRDEARRRSDERRALLIRRDEALRAAAETGIDEAAEEALAAEQSALVDERGALVHCLRGHEVAFALAEGTIDHLGERSRDLRGHLAAFDRDLSVDRTRAAGLRAELQRARAGVADPWRHAIDEATAADIDAWEAECGSLRRRRVEERAGDLPRAEFRLQAARTRLDTLDRQSETIPTEARRDPAAVDPFVAEARERLAAAETGWREAVDRRGRLGRDLDFRRSLEADARAAEREAAVHETLSRLLGWNGLLRHRLREAEHSILACTNRFLREISGGDLELQLVEEGDSERALHLEAKVRTHGGTRVVETVYLSGSQKFRVAVSLALGIGQHARGAGRRIESVIIDEGFGSLDRQGRREMIAQLGDLQGALARIILVTHQEEIADAFPDGYRFEVIDGATVAVPFHR